MLEVSSIFLTVLFEESAISMLLSLEKLPVVMSTVLPNVEALARVAVSNSYALFLHRMLAKVDFDLI